MKGPEGTFRCGISDLLLRTFGFGDIKSLNTKYLFRE